jgi:hypothetical protein
MRKKPSFKELLFLDYYMLGPLSSGVLLIVIGIYFLVFESNQFGLIGFSSIGILVMSLCFWRLIILNKLFDIGIEIKGKITSVSPIRRSYRITMEYRCENKDLKAVWIAVKNQKIRDLRNLNEVTLLVNPNKLKQVVILEVFEPLN